MKRAFYCVLLFSIAALARGEQQYVSDKLVVNVYAEADQESDKLASLESGDSVEVIDRAEGYAHVKLADGRAGWIKSSYLSAQTPAIVRLKDLEKRAAANASLPAAVAEELKQLKEQNAVLRAETDTLKQKSAQSPAQPPAATMAPAIRSAAEKSGSLHALKWSAGVALGAGVLGFAFGYRSIARRIERKYGKLKIY